MNERQQRSRVRKEMLRGAFEDNIEALTGQPAGTLRAKRFNRTKRLKKTFVIAAVILLAGISVAAWIALPDAQPKRNIEDSGSAPLVLVAINDADIEGQGESALEMLAERLSVQGPRTLMQEIIPLHIAKIAIDPGHGGKDCGTSLKFGLLEKDLTWDIAERLSKNLLHASIKTVLTRNGDETISLKQRATVANEGGADLFVSIHVNWLPNRHARGVETYFLGTTDDPFLNNLAAAENQDSGFSMSDYRQLLEGIYADVRQSESRRLAHTIQGALFETLKKQNNNIVSRGVLTAPFVVLVATEMPAILAEVACLSNDNEARLLAIPSYRQHIADALYAGIVQYSNSINPSHIREPKDIKTPKGTAEHDQRDKGNV